MQTINAEPVQDDSNPDLAPAVRPEQRAIGSALEPSEIKVPMTAAQAKVDAVASLTMKAYDRASTLQLTDAEIAAIQSEFPDEAFLPGAAGKDHLIYIQHSYLRDRLNQVFRPGQWSIVPRSRWAEDFTTQKGNPASRVYVEAMLVIRGCFVAEAVGEMEYFPNNASQNYGDACEGAKTAALRRCCKELGIGLQAWKKDWCEGWWKRKRTGQKVDSAPHTPPTARQKSSDHSQTPPEAQKPAQVPFPTPEQRAKMIKELQADPGGPSREIVTEYFVKAGAILDTETLEELPMRFVPATQAQMRALASCIAGFAQGEEAGLGFPPHPEPEESPKAKTSSAPGKTKGIPADAKSFEGVIRAVTLKEGRSAKGPWSLWGIKIADQWFNSFSATIGKAAQTNKGQTVTILYSETEKGKTVEDLIVDGVSMKGPDAD